MSIGSTSVQSSFRSEISVARGGRKANAIFQDLPLIDRNTRLSVIELQSSDKQIVNELVYRFCRVLTRPPKSVPTDGFESQLTDSQVRDMRKVLIFDMIGSMNPIRFATVMKRDSKRMQLVGICRTCKINSSFVTLQAHLGKPSLLPTTLKLVVIYQDEFYIDKTIKILHKLLNSTNTQVLFVIPKLNRSERDSLGLAYNSYQILRCDFKVNRFDIGPAPPVDSTSNSYQSYLNEVYFRRVYSHEKHLPDRVEGELGDALLTLKQNQNNTSINSSFKSNCDDNNPKKKLARLDSYRKS